MSIAAKIRTYWALGPRSLLRVGTYRLGLRSGLHPVQRLAEPAPASGAFFVAQTAPAGGDWPPFDRRWLDHVVRFDWMVEPLPPGKEPDWLANPLGRHGGDAADQPWWTLSDFGAGDIKGLWELSRFGWVLPLAAAARRGEDGAAERLNRWLTDWCAVNRPYRGPNWKCGQEASIRVMHLLAAAMLLEEDAAPLPGLVTLVTQHLARIAPTIGYALGQDNNHGTSEAVALFIGGSFVAAAGEPRGAAWAATGRHWLEERAQTLIGADGSFSQYAVNYHRLMLDSYALAEHWRRRRGLHAFSPGLRERLRAASAWLCAMVAPETGDAPNIGASDGARLLPLTACGYRDFRPSVQLAMALFADARAYPPGDWDAPARWLGISVPDDPAPPPPSRSFDDGGWHVLRQGDAIAVMRYPRFRFRPAQADALHLDLIVRGQALLRDAGTYSYNAPDVPDGDFGATACHNSVTFDGADQMVRLGRFLFGGWLRAEDVARVSPQDDGLAAAGAYRDARGNRHHRRVALTADSLRVTDRIDGPFRTATLRWRMAPGDWSLDGSRLKGADLTLDLTVEGANATLVLTEGREARDYFRMSSLPVLELQVDGPCRIITDGRF